jgi:hypothetical protein
MPSPSAEISLPAGGGWFTHAISPARLSLPERHAQVPQNRPQNVVSRVPCEAHRMPWRYVRFGHPSPPRTQQGFPRGSIDISGATTSEAMAAKVAAMRRAATGQGVSRPHTAGRKTADVGRRDTRVDTPPGPAKPEVRGSTPLGHTIAACYGGITAIVPGWCSGSIAGFEPADGGSNPSPGANSARLEAAGRAAP